MIHKSRFLTTPALTLAVMIVTSFGCNYRQLAKPNVSQIMHWPFVPSNSVGQLDAGCDRAVVEPACYGYHPTCWRPWPEGCDDCLEQAPAGCMPSMGPPEEMMIPQEAEVPLQPLMEDDLKQLPDAPQPPKAAESLLKKQTTVPQYPKTSPAKKAVPKPTPKKPLPPAPVKTDKKSAAAATPAAKPAPKPGATKPVPALPKLPAIPTRKPKVTPAVPAVPTPVKKGEGTKDKQLKNSGMPSDLFRVPVPNGKTQLEALPVGIPKSLENPRVWTGTAQVRPPVSKRVRTSLQRVAKRQPEMKTKRQKLGSRGLLAKRTFTPIRYGDYIDTADHPLPVSTKLRREEPTMDVIPVTATRKIHAAVSDDPNWQFQR